MPDTGSGWSRGLLVVAVACLAAAVVARPPQAPANREADACTRALTRNVFNRLVGAINAGDLELVDRLVARGDAFRWYSVNGERIGEAARNRGTLIEYISARHAQGERLRPTRFRYQGRGRGPSGRLQANFSMTFIRSARDYPRSEVLGKGATDCGLTSARIAVWSLGIGRRLAWPRPPR